MMFLYCIVTDNATITEMFQKKFNGSIYVKKYLLTFFTKV